MDENALLSLTAQIVSAQVSHNTTSAELLPDLINSVYMTLSQAPTATQEVEEEVRTPAVPIKKSVFPDYLVCLEDGKKLKMLKRHLATAYEMTPDQYRQRWDLPPDYPMVAPNYAQHRSTLAKQIGLGRIRERPDAVPAAKAMPAGKRQNRLSAAAAPAE